uniref:hypothetical protein n=1 Tax=Gelidibacter sp. TaxID=2018083 RepID=UPI0040498447
MNEKEILYYYPNRFVKSRKYLGKIVGNISTRKDLDIDENIHKIIAETMRQSKNEPNRHFDQDQLQVRMKSEVENIYAYSKFKHNGSNIFSFSKELLEMFDKTDVEDIEFQNIRHPYKEYYISLRDLNRPIDGTFMEYEHTLDGVYISTEFEDSIIMTVTGFNDKKSSKNWWYYPEFTNINTLEFKEQNSTVKDALDNLYRELESRILNEPKNLKPNLDRTYNEIASNIKLIINGILYLSTSENDTIKEYPSNLPLNLKSKLSKAKTKRQLEIAKSEIQRNGYSKINFVGQSFKNTNIINGQGNVSPHWRRGHWRNQPFGKELSENKIIWIQPTIVRADKGDPEKGHIYEIK